MELEGSGELQELPHRRIYRVRKMGKAKGIPLCLGFLFSCCALTSALLVGLALLMEFAEKPLIDGQVTQVW